MITPTVLEQSFLTLSGCVIKPSYMILSLIIMVAAITGIAYTVASLGSNAEIPPGIFGFVAFLLGLMLVAHWVVRKFATGADATLLPLAALLHGIGFVMITRLDDELAGLQSVWSLLGDVNRCDMQLIQARSGVLPADQRVTQLEALRDECTEIMTTAAVRGRAYERCELYARAIVILPGGFGTLDELFESLTLVQTHKMPAVPVILAGDHDYWDGLLDWIQNTLVKRGKISPTDLDIIKRARSTEEVLGFVDG